MARIGNFVVGLMVMGIVAGGVFLAFVYGGGMLPPPEDRAERPTGAPRFIPDDRGSDTGRQYTPIPSNDTPLNMATAEAWSLAQYATAVAGSALPDPAPAPRWADELPDCASGRTPCVFHYSDGPAAPAQPNLSTGGTNTGSVGHPQKDTDQAATFNGDKP